MRFDGQRPPMEKPGFSFSLNASLKGIGGGEFNKEDLGYRVGAARDPVAVPTDPVIVAIAQKCLCRLSLGTNCFVMTNVYGESRNIPYGASVDQWQQIGNELLTAAMDEDAR